jgi:bifunctional enzyme CysN/CysC
MTEAVEVRDKGIDGFLAQYGERELLRFLTCGSVDDGKSTLIGRLLHDSQTVYEDQMAAVQRDSVKHGTTGEKVDLALLVDGLQAEREQGITIDVAYRYFSTPRRKFIIADTPGHEQYTRNMATGASTCNLAIILVDARHGVLDQTRRHSFIASLLGIRHLVVAINKMDLAGWSQERFEEIRAEFTDFAAKLQVGDIRFIPLSALEGDNVVTRSTHMPWYEGSTLLNYLETVHIASDRNLIDFRFPVQHVLRPHLDYRGYCGTIASGAVRPGDPILVLPSGRKSRVRSIDTFEGAREEAFAGMAVTITLEDEIDVSRGDMLVHENNVPQLDQRLEAMVVWMHERPLERGREYLMKQTTVLTPATITDLRYRINVTTLHREESETLELNAIGRVGLQTPRLLAFDPYIRNRSTGAFILIDRITNATVGAGMILDRDPAQSLLDYQKSPDAGTNIRFQRGAVTAEARAERLGQKPFVVWLTGLPRSGKSSIAWELESRLFEAGIVPTVLDGENLRMGINSDLGFSEADRKENVRRAAEMAKVLTDQGLPVVVAMVSQTREQRELARSIIGPGRFVEAWCSAPIEVCEARDEDGLYAKARSGELANVTGVNYPYEPPEHPDLELPTHERSIEENVESLLAALREREFIVHRTEN